MLVRLHCCTRHIVFSSRTNIVVCFQVNTRYHLMRLYYRISIFGPKDSHFQLKTEDSNTDRRALVIFSVCVHVSSTRFWRNYGSLSRHLMALKLQHYTKFLFVRDPFVRLISAFRNKFGRCVSTDGGEIISITQF